MKKELSSLEDHEVADLIPRASVPAGHSVIGTRFNLLADNRSSLSLASDGNYSQRSRHIAVRYAALRELIQQGIIKLDFVASSNMLADICTKYCVREVQDSLIRQISSFN